MSNHLVAEILQQAINLLNSGGPSTTAVTPQNDNHTEPNQPILTRTTVASIDHSIISRSSDRLGTSEFQGSLRLEGNAGRPASFAFSAERPGTSGVSAERSASFDATAGRVASTGAQRSLSLEGVARRPLIVDVGSGRTGSPYVGSGRAADAGETRASTAAADRISRPNSLRQFRELRDREVRSRFLPYGSSRGSVGRPSSRQYLRKFQALGSYMDRMTPTSRIRQLYIDCGLGERMITLNTTMSSEEVRRAICGEFSVLENVEFELLKAVAGGPGKCLNLLDAHNSVPDGATIPVAAGHSIIYVRPKTKVIVERDTSRPVEDEFSNDTSSCEAMDTSTTERILSTGVSDESEAADQCSRGSQSRNEGHLIHSAARNSSATENVNPSTSASVGSSQHSSATQIVSAVSTSATVENSQHSSAIPIVNSEHLSAIDVNPVSTSGAIGTSGHSSAIQIVSAVSTSATVENSQHSSAIPIVNSEHLSAIDVNPISTSGAVGTSEHSSAIDVNPVSTSGAVGTSGQANAAGASSHSSLIEGGNVEHTAANSIVEVGADGTADDPGDYIYSADIATFLDLQAEVFRKNEGVQPIFASRDDWLEQLVGIYVKDKDFSIMKKPRVIFLGEPGHDVGALTREYFDATQRALFESRYMGRYPIFEGDNDHKVPSSDLLLLRKGVFQAVGKFLAHSYINTGIALYNLSPCIKEYLCNESDSFDNITEITVEDLPSLETRSLYEKVMNWSQEFPLDRDDFLKAQDEAANIGFFADLDFTTKHLYLECYLLHYVMHVRKSQLDSMKTAFRETGVLKFIQGKEYLHDAAFPKLSLMIYSPAIILGHMEYVGDLDGRVKSILQEYIENMDSNTISDFLRCTTATSYLRDEKIVVNVGEHPWLMIQACFSTIQIPHDMDSETIVSNLNDALRVVGGFGAV